MSQPVPPDLILTNGRFTTLDRGNPNPEAVAITGGRFNAVGDAADVLPTAGPTTRVVDLRGRRAIPGLIDSHMHIIRGGLNYNLELRWDGVPSLADAMRMLKTQAQRTPPGQWVRIVGGFTRHQFAEKRLPTIAEINAAAPDTPVFIMHLYDRALLNRAALRAVGYDRNTPNPPGGEIVHDASGDPTGLLIARPNAVILYATLARGPKLPPDQQKNSTRQFMREMNRLGVTSVIDAGGGYQAYPDDYAIVEELHREGALTLRIAYNLFTQKAGEELEDFTRWGKMVSPGQGDDTYRHNGAGEMLVFSAADFEDFREPQPELPEAMEDQLEAVVRKLVENRWPWRLHATYDQTIDRALDVFERVNQDMPFGGLHWFFDHAETISPRNMDRVAALGGGIAVQHRMMYQGEDFVERYGARAAETTPPIRRILDAGVPLGAGTDATRVASYNPWVSLSWLVTGQTLGGLRLYPPANRLDREGALRLWTEANGWFSSEDGKKGQIVVGQLADLAVLSEDYFSVPESQIVHLESVLTLLGGRPVYGAGDFVRLAPPPPPVIPDWSPVATFGGYQKPTAMRDDAVQRAAVASCDCGTACGVHGHAHAGAWGRASACLRPAWVLGSAGLLLLGSLTMDRSSDIAGRFFANRMLAFAALMALASPFLLSGILKLLDFVGAVAEVRALTGTSEALAPFVAALVIIVQIGASGLLLSGRRWGVTGGSALLAGFTIVATLVAHAWWTKEGLDRARDLAVFFEHIAICGGLALAVVLAWRR